MLNIVGSLLILSKGFSPHFYCPRISLFTYTYKNSFKYCLQAERARGNRHHLCFPVRSYSMLLKGDKTMENYGKVSAEAYDVWFPEKEYEDTEFFKSYIEAN